MHGPPRALHARTGGPRRRPRGSLAAPAAGGRAWTLGTVALQCENARSGQIEVRAVPVQPELAPILELAAAVAKGVGWAAKLF